MTATPPTTSRRRARISRLPTVDDDRERSDLRPATGVHSVAIAASLAAYRVLSSPHGSRSAGAMPRSTSPLWYWSAWCCSGFSPDARWCRATWPVIARRNARSVNHTRRGRHRDWRNQRTRCACTDRCNANPTGHRWQPHGRHLLRRGL